jgi:MoaA/NifB/PqqE/SkfB family radical SAM enzyme
VGNVDNGKQDGSVRNHSQLSFEQWRSIIQEADDLGVVGFVIAGGEPFLFPGLVELCRTFKNSYFVILTNGTTLRDDDYKQLKKATNVVVLVSIEGSPEFTNARRGDGVYENALLSLDKLKKVGAASGISVTITRLNYRYWMDESHLDQLLARGVRMGSFLEYIPMTPSPDNGNRTTAQSLLTCTSSQENNGWEIKNDHELMLKPAERAEFRAKILSYRASKPVYLIHSPGDEEKFGGCVSAGRGFAHVTPSGDLTPCPVSNIATHNIVKSSLKEGLASPLFKEICEKEHLLETSDIPCALFAHPEEVEEIANSVGAYRT